MSNNAIDAWCSVHEHVKKSYAEKFGSMTAWYEFRDECDKKGINGADVINLAIVELSKNESVIVFVDFDDGRKPTTHKICLFSNTENAQEYCKKISGKDDYGRTSAIIINEDSEFII